MHGLFDFKATLVVIWKYFYMKFSFIKKKFISHIDAKKKKSYLVPVPHSYVIIKVRQSQFLDFSVIT